MSKDYENINLVGMDNLNRDVTFQSFLKIIRDSLEGLRDSLEEPNTVHEASQFIRGQIYELRFILDLPETIIESLKLDKQENEQEDKGADNAE